MKQRMNLTIGVRPLILNPGRLGWRRRWLGSPGYWICQLGCWGLLSAMMAIAAATIGQNGWQIYACWFVGTILFSHLLRLGMLLVRARARTWFGFLGGALAWNLLVSLGLAGASLGFTLLVAPDKLVEQNGEPLKFLSYVAMVLEFMFLYGAWQVGYLGVNYFRGYREKVQEKAQLESAVKQAELRALKTQINPHFLFNSLNTLRSLIRQDPELACEAVTLLADLLRAALTTNTRPTIPFEQELETVRSYLTLEQLRFEERLQVRWAVADETLACPLPPSTLQLLVENALKHGIARRVDGGEIVVEAVIADSALRLTVTNPGRLDARPAAHHSTGIGLQNARERLRHLCGEHASLRLEQREPDLVAAVLTIPGVAVATATVGDMTTQNSRFTPLGSASSSH